MKNEGLFRPFCKADSPVGSPQCVCNDIIGGARETPSQGRLSVRTRHNRFGKKVQAPPILIIFRYEKDCDKKRI